MVDQVARKLAKPPSNDQPEEAQAPISENGRETLLSAVDITVVIEGADCQQAEAQNGMANTSGIDLVLGSIVNNAETRKELSKPDLQEPPRSSVAVAAKETTTKAAGTGQDAYRDYLWIDWVALVQVPQGTANAQPNLALVKAAVLGCPKGKSVPSTEIFMMNIRVTVDHDHYCLNPTLMYYSFILWKVSFSLWTRSC